MIIFNNKRKGFSLITAVFMILIVSSIGAIILSLSGKMVHETVIQHKKEQSILYAKSYTALGILAAISNECINTITAKEKPDPRNEFDIVVTITYLGSEVKALPGCGLANTLGGTIKHTNSIGNAVIIDTSVTYEDPFTDTTRLIRYHRRTIQKL